VLVKSVYLDKKEYKLFTKEFDEHENIFTILVGSNGTGKSRVLSKITNCLKNNIKDQKAKIPTNYTKHLDVIVNSKEFSFYGPVSQSVVLLAKNKNCNVVEPTGTKIIAVTSSPFDKFPIFEKNLYQEKYNDKSRYSYIGLKQSKNTISQSNLLNLLFRTFLKESHLFENNDLFKLLKLSPNISFQLNSRFERLDRYQTEKIYDKDTFRAHIEKLDPGLQILKNIKRLDTLNEYCRNVGLDLHQFINLHSCTYEIGNRLNRDNEFLTQALRSFILYDDFIELGIDTPLNKISSEALLFLLDNNLINVVDIKFISENLKVTHERELSSGQKCIILTMLNIAGSIEDNSIICIDEPEISLHPKWQKEYISLLVKLFSNYKGCHFIIATHSPLIVSEVSHKNCFILSMENRSVEKMNQEKKNSSDYQLAERFKVAGNNNEYLNRLVVMLLSSLSKNGALNEEERLKLQLLEELSGQMEDEDHVKVLTNILIEAWNKVSKD